MNKNFRAAAKPVLILVIIAVACVALLAILDGLLYLPPSVNLTDFSTAYEAEYESISVEDVETAGGKVTLAASGTAGDTRLLGLFVQTEGYGRASSFNVIIVIDRDTGKIMGSYLKTQGSTGASYNYDPALMAKLNGTSILDFDGPDEGTIRTGATHSSNAALNAFIAARDYYQKTGGK